MAPALILIFTALAFFFSPSSWAQTNPNITVGASLTAAQNSNPWRSPSGDFAFGFQQLKDNPHLFLLSVWFDKIPDKTIVWYARGIDPVPRGSTLSLDRNGLFLRNPGRELIYNTQVTDQVAYGSLNDTGNLLLFAADSSVVWESFRNPSDTILPTQTLEISQSLISRKTDTNFSLGRFYATVRSDGNIVFNTKSVPSNRDFDAEYYNTGNLISDAIRVVFSDRALIYFERSDGQQQILSSSSIPPASENYYRASLDFDGVFALYYHPRNNPAGTNQRWTSADSWPRNICSGITGVTGSGACGYNNVCRLENRRPVCQCPIGFSLDDQNNPYGDCKPNSVQSCIRGENEGEYDLLEVFDTDWPLSDYEQIIPSSEQVCRSECLNDCLCAVAIYRSDSCWKKKLPLSNGRVDNTLNATAFLKFRKADIPFINPLLPTPSRPKRDHKTLVLVLSLLLGSSAFINFIFITAALLVVFLVYNKKLPIANAVHDTSGSNLRCFSYKELVQATNGFQEELGKGAFGIVYKGVIVGSNSNSTVAVKKLSQAADDSEKEFRNEVNSIGQTHHKNLVRLVGFCDEGPQRLLVYEYMSNGTLAGFLFGDSKPSWKQRTQIALGVARGITYLHEDCSTQIIHCDIKPHNILLDEYHNARISDFGLAKLLMMNQSKTLTNIRGTKGYVAPEWFRNKQITVKVDVYSFGVVLLEIITCRRSVMDFELEDGENPILTDWVWDCFCEGKVDSLVWTDEEASSEIKMVERFVKVGIWCIQEDASLRPTMKKACQMLEGSVEVGVPPCPYSFTSSA